MVRESAASAEDVERLLRFMALEPHASAEENASVIFRRLGRLVADPECGVTWYDVGVIHQIIRKKLKKNASSETVVLGEHETDWL